jgi:hypothetical protein
MDAYLANHSHMILSTGPERGSSLVVIECGLTALAFAVAFCAPRLGSRYFARVEQTFGRLARKQNLAVLAVVVTAFLLRLAILPFVPIPRPFVPNDFSFLLASDTFASGRLTNPTPVMWTHFESLHITMTPTYMSMYFPAQGLVLAAGKVLAGHPWYGILVVSAIMCGAICWMLQAWLPPTWALLGGFLAIIRLGLFSYWINTYSGGGSTAALGGALILGAFPRLVKDPRPRYAILLAIGAILLANSRPYEGVLLCLPVAVVLIRWLISGKNRPTTTSLVRLATIPLALLVAAGLWMGYYNYRVFKNPLTEPYTVNRTEYAMAPYFVWQSARSEPVYRHKVMRDFYYQDELTVFLKTHSFSGYLPQAFYKVLSAISFYAGFALLPPLIMMRRVLLDRRIRFLVICVLILGAGMSIEIFLIPHYLAPFTAAFYAIGLQAMRHLRVWSPGNNPVGLQVVRLTVTLCIGLAVLRPFAEPLHIQLIEWPPSMWVDTWSGPGYFGSDRASVESDLEQLAGKQLVIVRYSKDHNPYDEWVYNRANIDNSQVIWAREMDEIENQELINYYRDRNVWLLQPDILPARVQPYLVNAARPSTLD